jgi:hypothetical protein
MSDVVQSRSRERRARRFGAAVLLAGLAVGCGRVEQVEVRVSAPPTVESPPVPASTLGPTTSFQGAVTALDGAAGEMVVAVQIVWTPILKAESHARRVLLDASTRWEPALGGLSQVIIGDEVQVDALDVADGPWRALRVRLLDID